MLTATQLRDCTGTPLVRAALYLAAFNQCFDAFQINTPVRLAAFLAQVSHESASMRYTAELASGQAYTGREDLGNTRPVAIKLAHSRGTETGPFYKGHGLIQITGYDNHLAYSRWRYADARVTEAPWLLTVVPDAVLCAGWFWDTRKLNELADMNTEEGFKRITRRINGGYNGLADRKNRWKVCKEVLGV